jgi:hypothetical protein
MNLRELYLNNVSCDDPNNSVRVRKVSLTYFRRAIATLSNLDSSVDALRISCI